MFIGAFSNGDFRQAPEIESKWRAGPDKTANTYVIEIQMQFTVQRCNYARQSIALFSLPIFG